MFQTAWQQYREEQAPVGWRGGGVEVRKLPPSRGALLMAVEHMQLRRKVAIYAPLDGRRGTMTAALPLFLTFEDCSFMTFH